MTDDNLLVPAQECISADNPYCFGLAHAMYCIDVCMTPTLGMLPKENGRFTQNAYVLIKEKYYLIKKKCALDVWSVQLAKVIKIVQKEKQRREKKKKGKERKKIEERILYLVAT